MASEISKRSVSYVIWDHPLDGVLVRVAVLSQESDGRWRIEYLGTNRLDYLLRRRPVSFLEPVVLDAASARHADALRAAGWLIVFGREVDGAPANPSQFDLESAADQIGLLDEALGCDHERDTRAVLLAAWGAVNLLCDHEQTEDVIAGYPRRCTDCGEAVRR